MRFASEASQSGRIVVVLTRYSERIFGQGRYIGDSGEHFPEPLAAAAPRSLFQVLLGHQRRYLFCGGACDELVDGYPFALGQTPKLIVQGLRQPQAESAHFSSSDLEQTRTEIPSNPSPEHQAAPHPRNDADLTIPFTPPIGVNLYVVQGVRGRGSMSDVVTGTLPFVATMFVMIALLVVFPELALWLPEVFY